ncbi:GatB/YqeY domain-containing protein [Candidatus Contubernalis alkaliaceticus]|uniref:GatB/YqeY domain-containing protein n=1 Tax=Candidatus Contubernalis alkaliaceticus TaxID=338645 RepID=UPI001F4BD044|nr:GatB/YqeY domain-containing protein [Candidatus Contubernalis alkalaceticus]UNC93135.1 GatB/YqeY domain-containing protein [Candidatus Contubernalis alkalaceticus]
MALNELINENMKASMKAKDKFTLSVLRMMRSEIKNEEIAKREKLSDNQVVQVLSREFKKRKDSAEEYRSYNREDMASDLEKEAQIILSYLPEQMSEEQITEIIKEAVETTGVHSKRDMGKVMGVVMPKLKGKADGRLVNKIVQSFLE